MSLSARIVGNRSTGSDRIVCFHLTRASKANEMILIGDPITAEEAHALGLVMKVVRNGKVLEESRNFAAKLATLPRLAMEASKMLVNKGLEVDLSSGQEMETCSFANLTTSPDLKEGMLAFLEKRKPNFTD